MQIDSGAEAIIELEGNIVFKKRIPKEYRIEQIDAKLRKLRTRAEGRILDRLSNISCNTPKLIAVDEKEMCVQMEYIDGKKVRDVLSKQCMKEICQQIGRQLSIMHEENIIHSDLTTSNMIMKDEKVYFIDFGLSFISKKVEDRAVDLHLLKRALDSYHHLIADEAYTLVLKSYGHSDVIERLEVLEKRGRYKQKH